ncbi:hypothetical protein D9M72_642570 [compost metagenome]
MLGMFLIDRGTNDIFMLERRLIFSAKAFKVSNKCTNADRFRREFYDFLSLADFFTHPGEVDQIYAQDDQSITCLRPARK